MCFVFIAKSICRSVQIGVGLATMPRWIVATSKPQREKQAFENIERQGREVYSPQVYETIVSRGRRHKRVVPLFPRYLFVQIDDSWRWLLSTLGVSSVIMGAGEETPATLNASVIEKLRSMHDKHGIVELPSIPRFTHGQPVRLTRGCFAGCLGIYAGSSSFEREQVLLSILGRQAPVSVGGDALVAA